MKHLIAYKGDKKLKAALLKEITKHEKADAIVQGTYGTENGTWKGCAVACSLRSLAIVNGEPLVTTYDAHKDYETRLGIPQTIAHLEDRFFEGMTAADAKTFPRKFANAIAPGADLSLVWPRFAVWMLVDEKDGVINFAETSSKRTAIQNVADLYARVINGKAVRSSEWRDADAAATSYGVYAAAYAASAAYASCAAATTAAYAAPASGTGTAENSYYKKMADQLLTLLQEAEQK